MDLRVHESWADFVLAEPTGNFYFFTRAADVSALDVDYTQAQATSLPEQKVYLVFGSVSLYRLCAQELCACIDLTCCVNATNYSEPAVCARVGVAVGAVCQRQRKYCAWCAVHVHDKHVHSRTSCYAATNCLLPCAVSSTLVHPPCPLLSTAATTATTACYVQQE